MYRLGDDRQFVSCGKECDVEFHTLSTLIHYFVVEIFDILIFLLRFVPVNVIYL